MSKYVKDLITKDLQERLQGVENALLVNVVGMDANRSTVLRRELRAKNIEILVVKNSLARRATEGTPLAPAFQGVEGTLAVVWGGEDIVSLAKEIARLAGDKQFAPFEPKSGVMDGAALSADEVLQVSKWPSREEQIRLLLGQILSPGANLSSQLVSAGRLLASQIEKIEERAGGESPAEEAAEPTA